MELNKDLPIYELLENHINSIKENDTYELEISFYKKNENFSESEFDNFINVFRSQKYIEEITAEYLEICASNHILKIKGIPNIIKYSASESYDNSKAEIYKKYLIKEDEINNLFDYTIKLKLFSKIPTKLPDNWDDVYKKYSIFKDFIYKNNDISYIANIYRKTDEEYYSFKQTNIMKLEQNYDFKLIINSKELNNIDILQSIIKSMQALDMNSLLLTLEKQKEILNNYNDLVKDDIEVSYYNKKSGDIPLLTPKPVTLEKINLIDPKEYGAISILSEYTVTEKADGERLLMYIDDKGYIYLINNSYQVKNTGLKTAKGAYNSIVDGEFIACNKRKDDTDKNLYAAFDIYFINGKNITQLPLISKDKCRYSILKEFEKLVSNKDAPTEFIVKEHKYSENILLDAYNILSNTTKYPYDIDGLIFTPAKLALYSYYTNNPVKLTDNMKWDRVFKWKPDDQNTIDFLVVIDKTMTKNGLKYKEAKLFVGYNASQWEDIDIKKGLRLRYDKEFAKENRPQQNSFIPTLFRPTIYYNPGTEHAHIKQNSKGELRAENGDKIENNNIVEFRYINDDSIPVSERWIPIRVREDKTRLFKKGILSKTANELGVALNIWRSIHNPVTFAMITGKEPVFNKDIPDSINDRVLETDDTYYSRNIPRDYLLSVNMLNFHNQGIKKMLYDKPNKKGSLLELCCGEGGDMNRWLDAGYKFILGIDLVKKNIYNPKSGCYSRMLKKKNQFMKTFNKDNHIYFPDIVFACGDCGMNIKNGKASQIVNDLESEKIIKLIMTKKHSQEQYLKHIIGKGVDGFDVISCMFAVHYFFENEDRLNEFFINVSENLKKRAQFICTFMNGEKVDKEIIKSGGDMIEGKKLEEDYKNGMPVWAIIRRYDKDIMNPYGKKIDVYIENTQKFIPEYLVSFKTLVEKAREHGLELLESEMFEETFKKLKTKIPETQEDYTHLDEDIIKLDKDEIQKKFSFLNQWAIFVKQ